MELEVVVEAGLRELAEIRNVHRGSLAVEADADNALARIENGELVARHLICGGIERISEKSHGLSSLVVKTGRRRTLRSIIR